MHKKFKFGKILTSAVLGSMLLASNANAAILFQDDNFHDIESEAILIDANGTGATNTTIQFGNDAISAENGNITWDIVNNRFNISAPLNVTGGVSASGAVTSDGVTSTGTVNFSSANQVRIRETVTVTNGVTACTNAGELIVQTSSNTLFICTNAGTDTWVAVGNGSDATTLDGLDSTQFLRSDTSDTFTSGTLGFDAGTTVDVNGVADFGTASQFIIRNGAATPGTCTEGELFYNSTTNVLLTCTATNTWTTAGPADFEAI